MIGILIITLIFFGILLIYNSFCSDYTENERINNQIEIKEIGSLVLGIEFIIYLLIHLEVLF